jgi:hypothetical protein
VGAPPQQGWMSTPAFKLFERGLTVQTVKRFHGLSIYHPLTATGPDHAIDLLNVIVGSNGILAKLRLPIALSPSVNQASGPFSFWDFQQGIGTRQILAHFGPSMYYFTNDLANSTLIETNASNAPPWNFVEANNILFGANGTRMMKWTGTAWQQWGIAAPAVAPVIGGIVAGGLSPATGFTYKYAYKNSVTQHVGNASAISASTGPQAAKAFQLFSAAPPDPQVDTIVWFRSLDGGGNWYRLAEVYLPTATLKFNAGGVTVLPATGGFDIQDNTPDAQLDLTTQGPLINGLPLTGQYLTVVQGRIFIAGIVGAPNTIIYSGYEQIVANIGRPEESFPTYNQLLLNIGAEQIVGLGGLHKGLVAFSNTGKMWSLRGAIEDVTLAIPPSFSDTLEELPWTLGCLSHQSIQSTPYGLVWLAGDKTLQFWNGRSDPVDISAPVYPLLRTITPGTERQCVGAYFNWLERDWYALTCCTGGAGSPNTLIFWSLNAGRALEAEAQSASIMPAIEIFVSNLQADFIGTISTSTLQRKLLLSHGGRISEVPVRATDTAGLTTDFTTYPPTTGYLPAYWRSGYFGNETEYRSKMWRWARIVPDRGLPGYQLQARIVDDVNTIDSPKLVAPIAIVAARVGINQRGYRLSVEVDFPAFDDSMSVLELQVGQIATSDR